jgi:hypothetical protein
MLYPQVQSRGRLHDATEHGSINRGKEEDNDVKVADKRSTNDGHEADAKNANLSR